MRQRSDLWARIAAKGRYSVDTVAVIGGVTYSSISAPIIDRALLSDALSVGNCISASLKFAVLTENTIPAAARVVIRSRLIEGDNVTEWHDFGTFYIDKRETNNGLTTLQCYDTMLKASQNYVDPSLSDDRIGWPKSMWACVQEIATRIGVEIDPRTVIHREEHYQVPYPTNYTMMQVLGYIGATHGGNWIITPENKLRLVPLLSPPPETFDIVDYCYNRIYTGDGSKLIWQHYETGGTVIHPCGGDFLNVPVVIGKITTGKSLKISRVTIARDENLGYTLGDGTGAELRISENPYANQAVCNDLYAALKGVEYAPFSIEKACYDPCAELGDWILAGDQVRSVLYRQTLTFGVDLRENADAPGRDEAGSEYPFLTDIQRLRREDEQLKKYMDDTKRIVESKIEQTNEQITLEVQARTEQMGVLQESLTSRITLAEGSITAEVERATGAESLLASRISVTESDITAEVTRATTAEGQLSGRITTTASSITAEVSRATEAEGELSGRITTTANSISMKVSEGTVSSHLSLEKGSVSLGTDRLTINSTNFKLYGSGTLTATGSLTTTSGSAKTTVSGGGVNFYYDSVQTGGIRGSALAYGSSSSNTARVVAINVAQDALIAYNNYESWYWFALNNGLNPNGCTDRLYVGGTTYIGSTLHCGSNITFVDSSMNDLVSFRRGYTAAGDEGLHVGGFVVAEGDMWCYGTKNRVVETEHYGNVGLNALESASACFSDIGSGILDENGVSYVFLDPVFAETVDLTHEYRVLLTQTSSLTIRYVEKHNGYFMVFGEPGATFDWMLTAPQKGYTHHRLENVNVYAEMNEEADPSIFYADNQPAAQSIAYAGEFEDTLDDLAAQYLEEYEREVTDYGN